MTYWGGDRTSLTVIILYTSFVLCAGIKYCTHNFSQLYSDWFKNNDCSRAKTNVWHAVLTNPIEMGFSLTLLWRDAHQTELKMSCVAVPQTAANPGGRDHRLRPSEQSLAYSLRKMFVVFACVPTSSAIAIPVVVTREVENVWTNKSSLIAVPTDCRWRDINLISPPFTNVILLFVSFLFVSPSRTEPWLCCHPKHFSMLSHLQGSVLSLW